MGMAVFNPSDFSPQYRTTKHKPFQGRVKVYVVAEDDEDRSRVLYFETENLNIVKSEPDYNVYGDNRPIFPTKYAIDVGELEHIDVHGSVMRYENFLNEDVIEQPTYNEEDYD